MSLESVYVALAQWSCTKYCVTLWLVNIVCSDCSILKQGRT